MGVSDYLDAMERAFLACGERAAARSAVLDIPVAGGTFHAKAAALAQPARVAVKVNGNFPANPARHGLPAIQGAIILCDAALGYPLAIMDSIEITIQRTAAATALAARYLARRDADILAVIGCGNQGRASLRGLVRELPIRKAYAHDVEHAAATRFAAEMGAEAGIEIVVAVDVASAARASGVVVTCTPARKPFLAAGDVAPGTFVAAVGADSHDKQELEPGLLASAKLVVDSLEQCARIGELHHALRLGVVNARAVHAELGDVVAGSRPGRTSREEITVFDSTGIGLQDVAAAAAIYERALASGRGQRCRLNR